MEQEELTERVIRRAIRDRRPLGIGFLEPVYQSSLISELRLFVSAVEQAVRIPVHWRAELVGDFIADNLIECFVILVLNSRAPSPQRDRKRKSFRSKSNPENPANVVDIASLAPAHFAPEGLPIRLSTKRLPRRLIVKTAAGFTILELLVAMSVMALLLVLLLNMTNSATKLWRENENRVDSYREARAALGIISRDLQNALVGATNTNHFLVNETAFPKLSTVGGVVTNTNSASALFGLSALPAKAQEPGANRSDVCQVGYFLAYNRTTASATPSLNIYRYFRSSDVTFTNLTNDTLFQNPTIGASGEELLARNIIGFTVRSLDLVVATATNGTNLTTNTSLVPFVPTPANRLPHIVEVSITAVNQEVSKKLSSQTDWTDTNSPTYANVIRPVRQTFTTRIRLNKP